MALVLTVHQVGHSKWGLLTCVLLLFNVSSRSEAMCWYCAIRVGEHRINTAKCCTESNESRIILLAFVQSFKAKLRLWLAQ